MVQFLSSQGSLFFSFIYGTTGGTGPKRRTLSPTSGTEFIHEKKKNREKGDTRRGRGRGWEKGPGEERVQRNSVLSRGRRSKTRETRVKNEAGNMGRQKKYRKPKNTRSFGKH